MKEPTDPASRAERTYRILLQLGKRSEVTVSELALQFDVSEVQIRQDLRWLERLKSIERVHGGLKLVKPGIVQGRHSFAEIRRSQQAEEKRMLAAYACEFCITDGDYLILDSGTQMDALAEEIVTQRKTGLRIVSAAANLAQHFLGRPDVAYVQLGGALLDRGPVFVDSAESFSTESFFESQNNAFISRFCKGGHYKTFLTATGFSRDAGLAVNTTSVVPYKQATINAATDGLFILLNHAKFSTKARHTVSYCGLKPDGKWLDNDTPASIIVDTEWDSTEQEQAFDDFQTWLKNGPGRGSELQLTETVRTKFPQVRVFQTTLVRQR